MRIWCPRPASSAFSAATLPILRYPWFSIESVYESCRSCSHCSRWAQKCRAVFWIRLGSRGWRSGRVVVASSQPDSAAALRHRQTRASARLTSALGGCAAPPSPRSRCGVDPLPRGCRRRAAPPRCWWHPSRRSGAGCGPWRPAGAGCRR